MTLFTNIHPLALAEKLEGIQDDNEGNFSFEAIEGKDFKFNLKVNVVRQGLADIEDEEILEIIGDAEGSETADVSVALDVFKHASQKDTYSLVFRQNGSNWESATEFAEALKSIRNYFEEFADEE